jgi:hypothetical protein
MKGQKAEIKLPPRQILSGFCYKTNETVSMKGKEWNELAVKGKFKWKKVGDPREGVRDICGGGYEIYID